MQDLPALNPDGVTIGQPSPQQGIRRVDGGGQTLPGQGNGSTQSNANTGGEVSGVPGIVGSAVSMGIGQSPLGSVPGVNAGVGAAMQGGSLDSIQDAILGSVLGWGASSAVSALDIGYGLPGIAGSVASEFSKDTPNYGAAAIGSAAHTGGAMLGGMFGGPLGAMLGSSVVGGMADSSLKEGYLGDLADSRSLENKRDAVEDSFDVGVSDTEQAARVDSVEAMLDRMEQMSGVAAGETGTKSRTSAMDANFGFGLDDQFSATTMGQFQSSAEEAFGFKDLTSYFDSINVEDIEMDAMGYSGPKDPRSDWGRSMNDASLLGDRDLTPEQNMDRQPSETPGGLLGGGDDSGGGFGGVGADNDAGLGGRGGDADNDPN